MPLKTLSEVKLPGIKPYARGKVRELFDLGERLLIVATDRISAFDHVLPDAIPHKGVVLNNLSAFWFRFFRSVIKHHMITTHITRMGKDLQRYKDILSRRSMLVWKTQPLPVECVVRGYISGSAWKEYSRSARVCGIRLPKGLRESEKLPEPIFTPATKAKTGHDENITFRRMQEILGKKLAEVLREKSLLLYKLAHQYCLKKGIILCDTKFEFGLFKGEILLIDELLTPDSSRFWMSSSYKAGSAEISLDKQFVRDFLESSGWDKNSQPPRLPEDIIRKTSRKYLQIYRILTGRKL